MGLIKHILLSLKSLDKLKQPNFLVSSDFAMTMSTFISVPTLITSVKNTWALFKINNSFPIQSWSVCNKTYKTSAINGTNILLSFNKNILAKLFRINRKRSAILFPLKSRTMFINYLLLIRKKYIRCDDNIFSFILALLCLMRGKF